MATKTVLETLEAPGLTVTSRFGLGAEVWPIVYRHESVWVPCGACEGTGRVELKNGQRSCPDCYGRLGRYQSRPLKWMLDESERYCLPLTVGQVRLEIEAASREEKYMCHETGVGSGTLWSAERLFASKAEAQAACDEENSICAAIAKEKEAHQCLG